jgi:hypothetical protein
VLGNAMRIFGFGTLRYHIYTVIESACETWGRIAQLV